MIHEFGFPALDSGRGIVVSPSVEEGNPGMEFHYESLCLLKQLEAFSGVCGFFGLFEHLVEVRVSQLGLVSLPWDVTAVKWRNKGILRIRIIQGPAPKKNIGLTVPDSGSESGLIPGNKIHLDS
jgi:hypothetical protein